MRKCYQVTLFMVMLFCRHAYCQNKLFVIVDDPSKKNQLLNVFRSENGSKKITSKNIGSSFTLKIPDELGVVTVFGKNKKGDYLVPYKATHDATRKASEFSISHLNIGADGGFLQISLKQKNGEPDTITLNLQVEKPDKKIQARSNDGKVPPDCLPLTKENNFGEVEDDFMNGNGELDNKRVVYVYDFNSNPNKRLFYKVGVVNRHGNKIFRTSVLNPSTEVLRPSSFVQLKIVHVNRFLYDVTATGESIHYLSEPSALFNQFFLGDSSLLGKMISVYSNSISGLDKTKAQDFDPNDLEEVIQRLAGFLYSLNTWQAQILRAYDPCYSFPCCELRPDLDFSYKRLADSLVDLKISLASIENLMKRKTDSLTIVNTTISECAKVVDALAANEKKIKDEQKKANGGDSKKIDTLKSTSKELNDKKCTSESLLATKKLQTGLTNDIQKFAAFSAISSKLPSEKMLQKMAVFISHMVQSNYAHVVGPFSPEGQRMDFEVSIQSKDSVMQYFSTPLYHPDPIELHIPVLWKGFVSFSTGSFIGLNHNLQNKTYSWQQQTGPGNITDTTKHILTQSGYSNNPAGFSALGNFQWKACRQFGFGFSLGVGLTIEKAPRPVYLGGASIFLGNERQFGLTYGIAAMQVNQISANWEAVSSQKVVYTKTPSIDYNSQLKIGMFLSLTYTPFKSSKSKKKADATSKATPATTKAPKSKDDSTGSSASKD